MSLADTLPATGLADPAPRPASGRPAGTRWLGRPFAYATCAPILSVLGSGTMLLAPRLLGPVDFGSFSLLSSLFQVLGKGDLGLSQMADRELAARQGRRGAALAESIVRARWVVGLATLLSLAPCLCLAAWWTAALPPLDVALVLFAGTAAMVANGPVSIHRAKARIWEFTASALALQAGLTAPRLLGLIAGGTTGCFAAMALWFGALALVLVLPALRLAGRTSVLPLVLAGLPMFAFSWGWLLYLQANRWISAALSAPADFGLFAFAANLAFIVIALLGTVAQVRYPTILARVAVGRKGDAAGLIEREASLLGIALSAAVACAIPILPPAIDLVFPGYQATTGATMILAVSCVPLGIACWFVPILVALSPSPASDAVRTLAGGFAVLAAGMAAGNALGGIEGQAWGCVVGSLGLLAGVAASFRRLGMLGTGRSLRLAGLAAASVTALCALVASALPVRAGDVAVMGPPAGWTVAFEDRFERLSLWDAGFGTWQPSYRSGARSNADNRESQYYVDPRPGRDAPVLQRLAPFRAGPEGLVISARPIPQVDSRSAAGQAYASGMLTTAMSFRFTYGYAEIEARVPKGKGTWPAFWLLPAAGGWPPEIDVMEVLGDATDGYWATLHLGAAGNHREIQERVKATDLSKGFHAYAVQWTAAEIAWFLDGRRVFAVPTPAALHEPMYLLVNLAVGGTWPGPPDAGTPFPAEMAVRRIRVLTQPATAMGSAR
ncbi:MULTISPECIES: family 16 glycosylhydrolase [unclassified Methylobacterium]|uniref:family 16 glycosylhydrolase n=1 Tax=unclassified Methylobacterium TaxID=2615210 RepID=UPI002269F4FC|nr:MULTISPECIES: family 16 glycosylhydrolase [unclassified Methylobacterium]